MARTDKPKNNSNAAKKSKLKETIPRQPRGERGTFAAKTPVLPAKASVKRKAGNVKAKQPQQIALEDPFPASESIDLPFLDIDEFSDYCAEQNQAAINFVNETDFDAFVSKHCASPLQSLPERPVEISSPMQQPPTQTLPAPCAPQSSVKSAHPISLTPPQLSVLHNSMPLTPHRMKKSANCTARSHRLPAIDMFRLHAPSSPPPSFPSVPSSAHVPLTLSEAPHPSSARTRPRTEVRTVSPSSPQVCVASATAVTPPEHSKYPALCTAATSRSKLLTTLSVRPLPQPLLPLAPTPALLPVHLVAPHHTPPKNEGGQPNPPYVKGTRVLVTTGMHCGRHGVVRGVQRVGKKGPFLSGQWSVLLNGKDLVALPDAFLAKC